MPPGGRAAILALLPMAAAMAAETLEFDAGVVLPGAQVRGAFTLANRSAETWRVEPVQVGCVCTVVTPVAAAVPPGGTLTFSLAGQASRQPGTEIAAAWTTIHEGARDIAVVAHLKSTVSDYLDLPGGVVRVPREGVRLPIARGAYRAAWDRIEFEADKDAFRLDLQRDGEAWALVATPIAGGDHSGDFRCRISFRFLAGTTVLEHRQDLVLAARLPGPVRCSPGSLLVGAVVVGTTRTAEAALAWQDGHTPDEVATVTTGDPQRVAAVLADGGRRLVVTFTGREPLGQASGEVVMGLRGGHQVHVPYAAAVATQADVAQ